MTTDLEHDKSPGPPESDLLERRLHWVQDAAWLTLGVGWAGYLLLRPYVDETSLHGAAAIAGHRWVFSHLLGMLSFVALAVALGAAAAERPARSRVRLAAAATLGAVLVLPYYGAESFGLRAIAADAVERGDSGFVATFEAVRYDPAAMIVFAIGLLMVLGVGLGLAWSAHGALLPLGALVATMPLQYFAPDWVRMAHGVLMLGVCCWFVLSRTRS